MKEEILRIKELVGELHCMGTYGLVELELTKIEERYDRVVRQKIALLDKVDELSEPAIRIDHSHNA